MSIEIKFLHNPTFRPSLENRGGITWTVVVWESSEQIGTTGDTSNFF
jgi:hypothetical protein